MTTTYDPEHPRYVDEADVRDELTRVFDLCHGCRSCVEFCTTFPTLFDLIDQHDDRDAGRLTPAQQDQVVDSCFQCKRCAVNCPYVPGVHEWNLDFPRLMLRATAMQAANRLTSARDRRAARVLGRADLFGSIATSVSSLANTLVGGEPGSWLRRFVAAVTGVSAVRVLPTFADQRFSTWFARRPRVTHTRPQGRVTVFPTCLVEYQGPGIGRDLVRVYERNGIDCGTTDAGCCGAPWLHAGDIARFAKVAEKNVAILAAEVRAGTEVVVAQPSCSYTIRNDYPDHVAGPEARLVAEHTFDAVEYLMKVHEADDTVLDAHFEGATVETITYHASCHLRAQGVGSTSRDLMRLTGAEVTVVSQCSGVEGLWGLRAGNDRGSMAAAAALGGLIGEAGGDVVAGDCHLANTVIFGRTGREARHPLQIVARAYGIPDDS
jgi:Fe-S oxidoreductase